MAYDEGLATRIRALLEDDEEISERRMFGGIAFMAHGHMACGVVGDELMVRVGPEGHESALEKPHARPMDFTGKPMRGMIYVATAGIRTKAQLRTWVRRGTAFAASLPPKSDKKAPSRVRPAADKRAKKPKQAAPPKKAKAVDRPKSRAKADAETSEFAGFPKGTLRFIRGLDRNNRKDWFEAHRADYEASYMEPAKAFVCAMEPGMRRISKGIHVEPRVHGSLFRIHRDVRFSKDKTPYKAHLDFWFWEGEKKSFGTPGFFMRILPKSLVLGAGVHALDGELLDNYRAAVADGRRGSALSRTLEGIVGQGAYTVGGELMKRVPRGFPKDHPREELLRRRGLVVMTEGPLPEALGGPELVDYCLGHFSAMAPLHRFLVKLL